MIRPTMISTPQPAPATHTTMASRSLLEAGHSARSTMPTRTATAQHRGRMALFVRRSSFRSGMRAASPARNLRRAPAATIKATTENGQSTTRIVLRAPGVRGARPTTRRSHTPPMVANMPCRASCRAGDRVSRPRFFGSRVVSRNAPTVHIIIPMTTHPVTGTGAISIIRQEAFPPRPASPM
ncbi:MAG: hypothetical protein ACYTAQ_04400 [Planctomycetota bacterium]